MGDAIAEQTQRFMAWISRKIALHFRQRGGPDFQEREIWWASLGENIGSEVNGKNHRFERPVIVFRKFGNTTFLAVPCTTKPKSGSWYCTYHFQGREMRANMAQIRVISYRRLIRKMGRLQPGEFLSLKNALIGLLQE